MATIEIKIIPKIFLYKKEYIDAYFNALETEPQSSDYDNLDNVGRFLGIKAGTQTLYDFSWDTISTDNTIYKQTIHSGTLGESVMPRITYYNIYQWLSDGLGETLTGARPYAPPGDYAGTEASRLYHDVGKDANNHYLIINLDNAPDPIRIRWAYEVTIDDGTNTPTTKIFPSNEGGEPPYYESVINAYGIYSFSDETKKHPYGQMKWSNQYTVSGDEIDTEIYDEVYVGNGEYDVSSIYAQLDVVALGNSVNSVLHHLVLVYLDSIQGLVGSDYPNNSSALYTALNSPWELRDKDGNPVAENMKNTYTYKITYAWHKAVAFLIGLSDEGNHNILHITSQATNTEQEIYTTSDIQTLIVDANIKGPSVDNTAEDNIFKFDADAIIYPIKITGVSGEAWAMTYIKYELIEYAYYDESSELWTHGYGAEGNIYETVLGSPVSILAASTYTYQHEWTGTNALDNFGITGVSYSALAMKLKLIVRFEKADTSGVVSEYTVDNIFIKIGMGLSIVLGEQGNSSSGTYVHVNDVNQIDHIYPSIEINQYQLTSDNTPYSYPIRINKIEFVYNIEAEDITLTLYNPNLEDGLGGQLIDNLSFNDNIITARPNIEATQTRTTSYPDAVTAEGNLKVYLCDTSLNSELTITKSYNMARHIGITLTTAPAGSHYDKNIEAQYITEAE